MNPIRALIEATGCSQREIAKRLDMPSPVLNRYCTGKRKPDPSTALRLIEAAFQDKDTRNAWKGTIRKYLLSSKTESIKEILKTPEKVLPEVVQCSETVAVQDEYNQGDFSQ